MIYTDELKYTHSCHSGLPMDIAPKMTLEILRPEFPRRVYSIFGADMLSILRQCDGERISLYEKKRKDKRSKKGKTNLKYFMNLTGQSLRQGL